MTSDFDVIVIGGGLSGGLPAAAYLQKAGLRVLIVEANSEPGTFCCTHETWPQVLDSPHVGVSFAGNSPVIADLELERYGFGFAASPGCSIRTWSRPRSARRAATGRSTTCTASPPISASSERPRSRHPTQSPTCAWPVSARSRISTITSRRSAPAACPGGRPAQRHHGARPAAGLAGSLRAAAHVAF